MNFFLQFKCTFTSTVSFSDISQNCFHCIKDMEIGPGLLTPSLVFFLLLHTSCHHSPICPKTKILQLKTQSDNIYITVTWFSISILHLYNGLINFLLISSTKCIPFCFLNQLHDGHEVKPKLTALNTSLTSKTSLTLTPPCKLLYCPQT